MPRIKSRIVSRYYTTPGMYDVIVYQENGHYYAKNREGDLICADSPTACLQESVNYIAQLGGGRILVRRGTYYPTRTVTIPDGIKLTLEGEGDSTVFRYTDSFTLFFHRPNNPTWSSVLSFRNFKVDRSGSGTNRSNIIFVLYAFYDEYDNITIVDDYRNVAEDVGLYGRNSIVSIVRNCRFFNKSSPVWFHSYLVHIYDNYARNTALIGFAAGHLLSQALGFKQPDGYPLNGLVVIENNTCIDCGKTDEAYAVDNESSNPYAYGTGIIRNNMLISKDYSINVGFACIGTEKCIIENNTFIGTASGPILSVPFYGTRQNIYALRNNYIKVNLTYTSTPMFLGAAKLIIEDNYIDINVDAQTNLNYIMHMTYANYVSLRNNLIKLTFPSNYNTLYGITIEDAKPESRDLEFVNIENNNIIFSAGRPLTISFWATYQIPPLLKIVGNRLYSGSSTTDLLLAFRDNNTVKATILNNTLEGYISGLRIYADSNKTPTLIFTDIDMKIISIPQNIIVKYAKRNSGTATFNGDGTTTQFKILHNLVSTPRKILVTPASAITNQFYVTADNTYIYVNYLSPPPAGTNNIVIHWYAEV